MDMDVAEVIKKRRRAVGISQPELAAVVGVSQRQIARYEDGERVPLDRLILIADALNVSLRTLAGLGVPGRDLSGIFYSAWQTWMNGIERVEVERLKISQDGEFLHITGEADPEHTDTGSYPWVGEARLFNGRDLCGWYVATADGVASCGTLQLTFSTHGSIALGTWSGHSHDGISERGWGAMARTEGLAVAALESIRHTIGTLTTFPDLSHLEFQEVNSD